MADLNPTFAAPNRVGAFPGYSTLTTSRLLVATLFNPTTPVVVVCNGVTYTSGVDFTLTSRVGTASRWTTDTTVEGLWTGQLEITGLAAFTRYPFTVTQGARSNDGSTMTAPGKRDRFVLPFGTCHQNNNTLNIWRVEGYWAYVYEYAQSGSLPIPGVFWVDDYLYAGNRPVDDTAGTGLVATGNPGTTLDLDDYLMAWCSAFGMLGPDEVNITFPSSAAADIQTGLSRGMKRDWCRRHINLYSNEGDHTYKNDMGWETSSADYPNPRWTDENTDGPGKVAMDAFVGLMMPPRCHEVLDSPSDSDAYGWVCELGPVTLATIDCVTNGTGEIPNIATTGYADDGEGGIIQVGTVAGTGQIADVLALVNQYKNPINLFGMAHGLRYPVEDYSDLYHFDAGAQHPIYDHCIAEYQRLVTATGQTPPSIMDGKYTNGAFGSSVFLHGDYHLAFVYELNKPAYTGNQQEIFYSIGVGTWDGSTNFRRFATNMVQEVGDEQNNVVARYLGNVNGFTGADSGRQDFWGCMITVDGSASPVSATISLRDHDDDVLWEGTIRPYCGNLPSAAVQAFPGSPSPATE